MLRYHSMVSIQNKSLIVFKIMQMRSVNNTMIPEKTDIKFTQTLRK